MICFKFHLKGQKMTEQKFYRYDHVMIKEMTKENNHFPGNCEGIVMDTYYEKFGKGSNKIYDVYIK